MWQIAPNMSAEQFVQAYGQIGWLFACASTRANAVASQRQHIYKLDSEGNKIEDFKHPMNMLLTRPNPYLTGYKLKQLTQLYLDLLGEAFWVIERTRLGEPGELWIVNPAYMYVVPDSEKFIKAWVYKCNGKEIPVAVEDVVHLYYPDPNNPYRGIGPAQAAAVTSIQTIMPTSGTATSSITPQGPTG
jgi:phage portal protein BeeE